MGLPAAGWVAITVLIREIFAWLKWRKPKDEPKKEKENNEKD